MCSKGQRYGTILSFTLIFIVGFDLLSFLSSEIFYALEAASGSFLSINFTSPLGPLCVFFFLIHYALLYLGYALPFVIAMMAAISAILVLIDFLSYRRCTLLMGLTMVSLMCVFAYGITDSTFLLVAALLIGIILFDQTYFLNKSYDQPYAFDGLLADYGALFFGFTVEGNQENDVLHRHAMQDASIQAQNVRLIVFSIATYVLSVISLGLAYGWCVHLNMKQTIRYRKLNGWTMTYDGKAIYWFIKGLKWWFFTVLTCGVYWLIGCIALDKTATLATQCHIENGSNPSFFDGTMMDYGLIHVFGMVLTIVSLGMLYPIYSTMSSRYLINHTVIDGYRLIDQRTLKSQCMHWLWCYPLLIVSVGLFSGYDAIGNLIHDNAMIGIDHQPFLYASDEVLSDASVC